MPVSDTQPGWQSEKANHKTIPNSKKVKRFFKLKFGGLYLP